MQFNFQDIKNYFDRKHKSIEEDEESESIGSWDSSRSGTSSEYQYSQDLEWTPDDYD